MQLTRRIKKAEEEFEKSIHPNYSASDIANLSDEELLAIIGDNPEPDNPQVSALMETFTDDELVLVVTGKQQLLPKAKREALYAAEK